MRRIVVALLALALSGCASDEVWVRPWHSTEYELQTDWAACRLRASEGYRQPAPAAPDPVSRDLSSSDLAGSFNRGFNAGSAAGAQIASRQRENDEAELCLMAKGWRRVEE